MVSDKKMFAIAFHLCFRIYLQKGMKLNGIHKFLAFAFAVNTMDKNMNTVKKNTETL
jgi:hypothetical protein